MRCQPRCAADPDVRLSLYTTAAMYGNPRRSPMSRRSCRFLKVFNLRDDAQWCAMMRWMVKASRLSNSKNYRIANSRAISCNLKDPRINKNYIAKSSDARAAFLFVLILLPWWSLLALLQLSTSSIIDESWTDQPTDAFRRDAWAHLESWDEKWFIY